MSSVDAQRKAAKVSLATDLVSSSLFTAAAASNAIPIAGQFAAAGLAIAGMFAKIFAGRRQKKKEQEAAERLRVKQEKRDRHAARNPVSTSAQVGGVQAPQSIVQTVQAEPPTTPSFNTWGGGDAPTVQQVLNRQMFK